MSGRKRVSFKEVNDKDGNDAKPTKMHRLAELKNEYQDDDYYSILSLYDI